MNETLAFQEPVREELHDGKIVLMSPRPSVNHNFVVSNIYAIFNQYLKGKPCVPFADGTDLYLTEKDRFVPDGMLVCDPDMIQSDGVHGTPSLVVEVLSPGTMKRDKSYKMQVYASCGVREYWLVNPTDKSVEQYLLEDGRYTLHDIYAVYPDYLLKKMTREERDAVVTAFRCSLFDDLVITLEDVFYRVI